MAEECIYILYQDELRAGYRETKAEAIKWCRHGGKYHKDWRWSLTPEQFVEKSKDFSESQECREYRRLYKDEYWAKEGNNALGT